MGVKGRRIRRNIEEPTLLGNINDIIHKAKSKGFVNKYTVDIEAIVKSHGLEIKLEELPSSVSGYLKKLDDKWVIGVNINHHIKRQRFTIAHEFAHYILHRQEGGYFEDTIFFRHENDSSLEYKANEFASELLMPDELLNTALEKGTKKIVDLAESFVVSVQAIKFRARDLGYSIKTNG